MRMHLRPGYLIHKSCHHAVVSLQVWRNNRTVAHAFRETPAPRAELLPASGAGGRRAIRTLANTLVLAALAAGICFLAFRWMDPGPDGIGQEPTLAIPAVPIPIAQVPAVPVPVTAPEPAQTPPPSPARAELSAPVVAGLSAPPPAAMPVRFPAHGNILLACKRDRTLYAYSRAPGGWRRIAAFPMAIGHKDGDKDEKGDGRTPEGRYWITGMHAGGGKGPAYGALVFPLDYPRPGDKAEGKGGDGIWIHGVPAGTLPTYTRGCIALANEDMLALAGLADAATPIVILPDSLGPDPARLIDMQGIDREYPGAFAAFGRKTAADSIAREAALKDARAFVAGEALKFPELSLKTISDEDRREILARLEKWRLDWSNRALDAYASNYDPAFRDRQGRTKPLFIERKGRIFASKTRIAMEIADPKVESECYGRVRVSFRQDYLAESPAGEQRSSETKTIRMDEGLRGWLIVTE